MVKSSSHKPRKRLTREERRERILKAALKVFSKRGYGETAMDDIARSAGITRSVLYDHFTSKKDLYLTLLRAQRDEVIAHVRAAAATSRRPRDVFVTAVDSFFSFVREHPVTWQMLFHDYVGDPEVMAEHSEAQGEASLIMSRTLVGGSGLFPGFDQLSRRQQQVLAHLWGAGLNAVARWWRDNPKVPQQQLTDAAILALWPGLRQLARKPPAETAPRVPRRKGRS